jgi:hypothetical protein
MVPGLKFSMTTSDQATIFLPALLPAALSLIQSDVQFVVVAKSEETGR